MAPGRSISGYGCDYEHKVSRAIAIKLLAPHSLPKMGYESCLVPGQPERLICPLMLQNISGTFVVASPSYTKDHWKEVYGFDLP